MFLKSHVPPLFFFNVIEFTSICMNYFSGIVMIIYATTIFTDHVLHTCQVLRFRRSHYGFLETLKTTAVVGKDYGFMLGWGWGCNLFGNHLIMFGLFLDELMCLSQYC